jgi:hypothetical protein
MWIALAVGLIATLAARGVAQPVMDVGDFVRYRGYLALSNVGRAVAWMCWALMAARATSLQDARERTPVSPAPTWPVPAAYASSGWAPPQ